MSTIPANLFPEDFLTIGYVEGLLARELPGTEITHQMILNRQDQLRRERKNAYYRNRRKSDPNFRLVSYLRGRLYAAVSRSGAIKDKHTMELLGCSIDFLRGWLEAQFKPGMTWDNYGPDWHVDHKRPIASFDVSDPKQRKECFHYTNLQPLWATENFKKNDTYELPDVRLAAS